MVFSWKFHGPSGDGVGLESEARDDHLLRLHMRTIVLTQRAFDIERQRVMRALRPDNLLLRTAILHLVGVFSSGAMGAAEHRTILFNPMADNAIPAVTTHRSQRLNGTLKAIEGMHGTLHRYVKRLVIFISTSLTLCHVDLLLRQVVRVNLPRIKPQFSCQIHRLQNGLYLCRDA